MMCFANMTLFGTQMKISKHSIDSIISCSDAPVYIIPDRYHRSNITADTNNLHRNGDLPKSYLPSRLEIERFASLFPIYPTTHSCIVIIYPPKFITIRNLIERHRYGRNTVPGQLTPNGRIRRSGADYPLQS